MGAAGQTRQLSFGTDQGSLPPTRPIYTQCTRLIVIFRTRLPTVQLVPITAIRLGPAPGAYFSGRSGGSSTLVPLRIEEKPTRFSTNSYLRARHDHCLAVARSWRSQGRVALAAGSGRCGTRWLRCAGSLGPDHGWDGPFRTRARQDLKSSYPSKC